MKPSCHRCVLCMRRIPHLLCILHKHKVARPCRSARNGVQQNQSVSLC